MQMHYKTMSDGFPVAMYEWTPEQKPKAVLHIVHGMAEHAQRYDRFAQEACTRGFAVCAADHRGHGKTAQDTASLGYLSDGDGFGRVVEDQAEINAEIRERFPSLPIIIIGHSFGSFVTQGYIERHGSSVTAAVLIGSAGPNPSIGFASLLAALNCVLKGRKAPAKLMTTLIFGSYNHGIRDAKTASDWLSRDAAEVQKYCDDERCGFVCTAGFYRDFMRGLQRIHKQEAIRSIPVGLPILITSGSEDPVSNKAKSIAALYQLYQAAGIADVTLKIYDGARHEILNETNRAEVTADILRWIEQRLQQ